MNAPIVHAPQSVPGLSPHEQSILRVLLYFNIFDHPLTAAEIFSFFPCTVITLEELRRVLESNSLQRIVKSRKGHYFLHSATESCVETRLKKEHLARRRTKTAMAVARFIRMFPFVRAVMLSGELSKGVASKNSDIDFVIVTEKRRLWICRSLLILFKKVFLFNSKKYFCLNHFITEDRLTVELRNIYSATEIATLKPLYNHPLYMEYIRANQWIREFFPHWDMGSTGCVEEEDSRSIVQRVVESFLPEIAGDELDSWLLGRWRQVWQRRYAHLSEEERNHKFRCDSFISTAYGEDFQQKVLAQYAYRLRHYRILGFEQRN
jgi:hypothetical protein